MEKNSGVEVLTVLEPEKLENAKPKIELTEEQYINAQRTMDLMVFGPIEGIYNTIDLMKEYNLVKEKKSKLSRKCRDRIEGIVESGMRKFKEDTENKNTARWDSMQSLLEKSNKMLDYLHVVQSQHSLY